jgi:agmatine/peptidylarginine deiminase
MNNISFPAEWHPQYAVQLTWPHAQSDWAYLLNEVEECFIQIANEIARRQQLIIVCSNPAHVKNKLANSKL